MISTEMTCIYEEHNVCRMNSRIFDEVRVALFLVFCVVFCLFLFVCLRPVSCVPKYCQFLWITILDYPFGVL
jgi:hypothetical protein